MELTYKIIRSRKRRRTITLRILEDGAVVIQAPWHTPRGEIDAFFYRKKPWIIKKKEEQEKLQPLLPEIPPSRSSILFYLGEPYPVQVVNGLQNIEPLVFTNSSFMLHRSSRAQLFELFQNWCRQRAADYIPARVSYYSHVLGLSCTAIRISHAVCRWGSCSSENRLFFSWRCIMAPKSAIDYVVVHELAHIRHKNHSPTFWNLVASVMPSYKDQQRWLRENDGRLPR
jgi:predicted metal-dependent hydrolase